MPCYFIGWLLILSIGTLWIIYLVRDDRPVEHNICAKGHWFNTRFLWISDLWWRKHEKCYDGRYIGYREVDRDDR